MADDIIQRLKALKPDEPPEEINLDVAHLRQQKPGITDDEIFQAAQKLVGGGAPSGGPPAPAGSPLPPAAPMGPMGGMPTPPAGLAGAPEPALPAGGPPAPPVVPPSMAHPAAMAALEGLAGFGDALAKSHGGNANHLGSTLQAVKAQRDFEREAPMRDLALKAGQQGLDQGTQALKKGGIEIAGAEKSAADLKALQDPSSDLSKSRQAAYRPILLASGFKEADIAKIPGGVIEDTMKGANSLAEAKARLAELKMNKDYMLSAKQMETGVNMEKAKTEKAAKIAEIDAQLAKMGMTGRFFNSEEAKSLRTERAKLAGDGGGAAPAAATFAPDVIAYSKAHGITPEQAQAIKNQRTAGRG